MLAHLLALRKRCDAERAEAVSCSASSVAEKRDSSSPSRECAGMHFASLPGGLTLGLLGLIVVAFDVPQHGISTRGQLGVGGDAGAGRYDHDHPVQ